MHVSRLGLNIENYKGQNVSQTSRTTVAAAKVPAMPKQGGDEKVLDHKRFFDQSRQCLLHELPDPVSFFVSMEEVLLRLPASELGALANGVKNDSTPTLSW